MTAKHSLPAGHEFEKLLQEYVDGTLDEKRALGLHLRAQSDPELQSALDETKQFFTRLDAMVRDEPSVGFETRILASVPLERYATAPRRRPRVIEASDLAPNHWLETLRSMGRVSIASVGAYLLTLALAGTRVGVAIDAAALAANRSLQGLADRVSTIPVVAELVAGASGLYDVAVTSMSAWTQSTGIGAVTFMGGAFLVAAWLVLATARRRRASVSRI